MNQVEQELVAWLKERNVMLDVTCMAPKGGAVSLANFIPDGWLPTIVINPAPQQGGTDERTGAGNQPDK